MSDSQGNSPRVIFVGDSGVGKTSIIHYMKFGSFDSHSLPTVGAGWTSMDCYFENKKIEYQLWDTAGQEIYRSLVPIYFKNAIGAIICFSLTDAISFQSLQSWVDQCLSYTANPVKICIVGNKIDSSSAVVDELNARNWAQEHGFDIHFTSAFTGQNVNMLSTYIAQQIVIPSLTNSASNKTKINASSKKGCC